MRKILRESSTSTSDLRPFRSIHIGAMLLGISVLLNLTSFSNFYGQEGVAWSDPVNISHSSGPSTNPSVVVDSQGTVHLIWSEETGEDAGAIYYSRNENGIWSTASDVLVSPWGYIPQEPELAIDSHGYLHVVWQSGNRVYYSKSYATIAESAQSWQSVTAITDNLDNLGAIDLTIDSDDGLHVAFARRIGDNGGIYHVSSADSGENWSSPKAIFRVTSDDRMVDNVRIAAGSGEFVHVVWIDYNYPETFPPLGVRYASSADGGSHWTIPVNIADGPYNFPELNAVKEREIHIVWSGTSSDRYRFHVRSLNDGQFWEDISIHDEIGGYLGEPSLSVDSHDAVHWIQSVDHLEFDRPVLYYKFVDDSRWSPGTILLERTAINHHMTNVSSVVGLGNQLHVVVQTPLDLQGGDWQYDLLYLSQQLDAPGYDPEVLPAPTATAVVQHQENEDSPLIQEAQADSVTNATNGVFGTPSSFMSPESVILIGIVPAIVLIIALLAFVRMRKG